MAKSLDDSQLLRLASDPRKRLFPPLRGVTVFGPLVVIAGLIPCLMAIQAPELDDNGAGWGLRALDVVQAHSLLGWLEPGREGLGHGFASQPPLSSWLQALIAPRLGMERLNSWRAISLVMSCCTIWGACLLARRLGGASFGLMTAILLCFHPVMFLLATRIGPASVGTILMLVAYWGFLSHLEGPAQLVSLRLLLGSVAWGLALLAVGPVAVALLLPVVIQTWLLREGKGLAGHSWKERLWQVWLGTRTLLVYVVTGLSFSGWWQVMMLSNHDGAFMHAWLTGTVELSVRPDTPPSFWRGWLIQNAYLVGWLLIGLAAVIRELRQPTSELARRRCQFLLVWWLCALGFRAVFDIPALRLSCLISTWDVMLLIPTAMLASWGGRTFVMRGSQLSGEALAVILTLSLGLWRASGLPWVGVAAFLAGWLGVLVFPSVLASFRGGPRRWNEKDWSRLMRAAFVTTLLLHTSLGLIDLPRPNVQSRSLTELRQRTGAIASTPRVTLVASTSQLPESLLFVLRTQWPDSELVVTGQTPKPTSAPDSELYIEWAQSEGRIINEIPPDRQATILGDPLRFRGKRLMIYEVVSRHP